MLEVPDPLVPRIRLAGFRSTSTRAATPPSLRVVALAASLVGGCSPDDFEVRLRGPEGITAGSSAELTSFIEGGAAPYTCTWSGEGVAQNDCAGAVVTPSTTTTYTVTATDDHGVSASASVEVGVFEPLNVALEGSHDLYRGQSTLLSPGISGGVPELTCTWALDGQTVSERCDPLSVSPDQDSAYSLLVRDGASNVAFATALVRVVDALETSVDPALSQHYAGDDFLAFGSVTGGFPPITCAWTLGGVEISDRCDRIPLVATDDALLTFQATDALGTTASATADVRVLKLIPSDVSEVVSGDPLTLTGAATGLIGARVCAWTQDGAPIPTEGACTLSIQPEGRFWTSQTHISLTLTDSDTGGTLSTDLSIAVLPPTCDDGVHNGTETDLDCGGRSMRTFVNEVAVVHYPDLGGGNHARDVLLAEVVVPEEEVDFHPLAQPHGSSVTPRVYELVEGVYVPRDAQPISDSSGFQFCRINRLVGDDAVFTTCGVSYSGVRTALAVVRNDSVLVDFIVMTGGVVARAEGGPADGSYPRNLAFPPPVTTLATFAFPIVPSTTTCLAGEGSLPDFTWEAGCTPTLWFGVSDGALVNPEQALTSLPERCPRCLEGETCEAALDCDADLSCDEASQLCAVEDDPG